MLDTQHPLLVIGGGNMAQAMISGWLNSGFITAEALCVVDRHPECIEAMQKQWGFAVADAMDAFKDRAFAMVMLAVKPQIVSQVLPELTEHFASANPLITSVAAGVPIAVYEKGSWPDAAVCRIMPNTPAAVGEGMSMAAYNAHCTEAHKSLVQSACESFGAYTQVDEDDLHTGTAVAGSGPAYIFYLMEQLISCAMSEGLDEAQARLLVTQTVKGAASFAQASDLPISQLRKNVTSPNGTTQAGLEQLMCADLEQILQRTIRAAKTRSEELAA
ncbi:MAG: pyrroline-5-carboxylate reductase [Rickettsiales bacterium]|nr:pyrroline-5-carboxylate reductase [Rickettsiales bacterium]